MTRIIILGFIALGVFSFQLFDITAVYAKKVEANVEITILHTNDLHSRFRGQSYPTILGGVARLKTAIDQVRATTQYTALVDGGDWSEGSIYYTEGGGESSVRMMDHLGYDFAVVGNHDWLNGPNQLLDVMKNTPHRTKFLSYNLTVPDSYERKSEFEGSILPYWIQDYGGYKVAFIGLSTYEFIYDKFFSPIKITEPFIAARELAQRLKRKQGVDGVIVISHNSVKANALILKAGNTFEGRRMIDLIIGAHDHKILTEAVKVKSCIGGDEAWIVEAGMGGKYLGQVKVKLTKGKMELENYQLTPIDATIAEDPSTLAMLNQLEDQIETKFGPIFHDHIGDSQLDLSKNGENDPMADFVTDAYRRETGSNFSMESSKFVYSEVTPGEIRTADVFNYVPAVYNPHTHKTWTLRTVPIKGNTLKWVLYLMYGTKKLSSYEIINVSGLKFHYDPLFMAMEEYDPSEPNNLSLDLQEGNGGRFMGIEGLPVVKDIQIMDAGGEFHPMDDHSYYTMATGGGIIEAIEFINSHLWTDVIPLDGMKDTLKENWRVLVDQIRNLTPLSSGNIVVGGRAVRAP